MAEREKQYHEELKKELKKEVTGSVVDDVAAPVVEEGEGEESSVPDAAQIAQDTADMPTLMMSRKKRKLYDAMKVPFTFTFTIFIISLTLYLCVFV